MVTAVWHLANIRRMGERFHLVSGGSVLVFGGLPPRMVGYPLLEQGVSSRSRG